MSILSEILANEILVTGLCGWFIAQIAKTIIYLIINKELRLERMVGDGGMPSCHSATVMGAATAAALSQGVGSPIFAVTLLLAIIVMHDAMGVRLETGKQAKILNELLAEFREKGMAMITMSPEERLKEFVGHTGSQVFVGAVIGVLVAIASHFLIYS